MKNKIILAATVLVIAAVLPFAGIIDSDEADSAPASSSLMILTSDIGYGGFDNRTEGHLDVPIINNNAEEAKVRVYVTYQNSTDQLASTEITVSGNGGITVASLVFMIGSSGEKSLTVHGESLTPEVEFVTDSYGNSLNYANVVINVNHSIWSDWTTYVAIILVVILIAVAFYVRGRNVPKKEKTMTFTEMEQQERNRRSAKEAPKTTKTTTERRRYQSKRK
ncbi:MAG: hypothetical protein ACOX8L_00620 [Candidatus Methanomethylophilaceae archaeon]|jgi:hypothetical protein